MVIAYGCLILFLEEAVLGVVRAKNIWQKFWV